MRPPVSDSEPSSARGADRQPRARGERRLDRPGAGAPSCGAPCWRPAPAAATVPSLRGLGRRLVRRLLLGREQEEPDQDHEEAERRREDQVLALVVHRATLPSPAAKLAPGSTAAGPKGQGDRIRWRRSRRAPGRAAGPASPGSRARNRICAAARGTRASQSSSMRLIAARCRPSWLPQRSQGMIG